jgi:hypothetical protein
MSGVSFHPSLVPASLRQRPGWVLLSGDRVIGALVHFPALEHAWFNGADDADGVGLLIAPGEAIAIEMRLALERAGVRLVSRPTPEQPSNGDGGELPAGGGEPPQPAPQARGPAGTTKNNDEDEGEDEDEEAGAPEREARPAPSLTAKFELTVLAKEGGPLTKRISLAPGGSLLADG